MRVWITGASGLIGNYLVQTAPQSVPAWQARGLTRDRLDLLDFAAVRREFSKDPPNAIIHCAAISQTPACQQNPALARRVNVDVTALLAELAAEIPFIFFSTDLVFDGRTGNYDESSLVNPLSVYGETKAEAEQIVLGNQKHTVVRTSLNIGTSRSGNRGFNEELRRRVEHGEALRLFMDEFRCPIHASVTARAVWELVSRNCTGLFHVAGTEKLSRLQMGKLFATRWPELQPVIEPMSIRDFRGAPRAPDTSLNCAKVQKQLSFPLPGLTKWFAEH
jgi:dTDP-4-dehydrorhamnose reductase